MTLQRSGGAAAFSESAEAYAATMAPSLRPVAERVVAAAALRPGESVLDVGTGTGNAAALARGQERRVVGLDGAPGMLAIARRDVPGVEFIDGDFTDLPFAAGTFDVVVAAHALLFAEDRPAALAAWRAVTRPGGRLSLSVPGPLEVTPLAVFAPVYEAYGMTWGNDYPVPAELAAWASEARWSQVTTDADPDIAIRLRDVAAFRTWLGVGSRGRATREWSAERREAFIRDLLRAAPRDTRGWLSLPFGALYLTATAP